MRVENRKKVFEGKYKAKLGFPKEWFGGGGGGLRTKKLVGGEGGRVKLV